MRGTEVRNAEHMICVIFFNFRSEKHHSTHTQQPMEQQRAMPKLTHHNHVMQPKILIHTQFQNDSGDHYEIHAQKRYNLQFASLADGNTLC